MAWNVVEPHHGYEWQMFTPILSRACRSMETGSPWRYSLEREGTL